jgi:hypothetical protein
MNDLELLRRIDPAAGPVTGAGKDDILAAARLANAPRRTVRRRGLTVAASIATVLAAGGGGIAYALLSGQPPASALKINCAAGVEATEFRRTHEFTAVLDTTTGDPVADCAAEYARLNGAAPDLRAYSSGSVFVWVVPVSWPVPDSWQPLPQDFTNDATRLELKQRVDDRVDGPNSQCMTVDDAVSLVNTYFTELHQVGWNVERGSTSDAARTCAQVSIDESAAKTVVVQTVSEASTAPADAQDVRLATAIRRNVTGACLDLDRARAAVNDAITGSGADPRGVSVVQSPDRAARCSRVDMVVGGRITIVLHGPRH